MVKTFCTVNCHCHTNIPLFYLKLQLTDVTNLSSCHFSGHVVFMFCCSGGSGRTGTYIAISILLDRLKVEGVVDVFQTIRALRLQRMLMVQTLVRTNFIGSFFCIQL